jgi:hypothetical protein
MIATAHAQALATLKAAIHLVAAFVIVWFLYRVANGQYSLL